MSKDKDKVKEILDSIFVIQLNPKVTLILDDLLKTSNIDDVVNDAIEEKWNRDVLNKLLDGER